MNFNNGDIADWNWIGDPSSAPAAAEFYAPIICDPVVSRTMFVGHRLTVWRTKTSGMGTMTSPSSGSTATSGPATSPCSAATGSSSARTPLTDRGVSGDRAGGSVAAVERTPADTSTAGRRRAPGRVFISKNVDADPASVGDAGRGSTTTRRERPDRFVSGDHVDPANPNHAWVSYSGSTLEHAATPGHVFEVTLQPGDRAPRPGPTAVYDLGDLPITDVVRDDVTGDLYASTDFGVLRLLAGATSWTRAAPGCRTSEVAGLTIVPGERKLYAASHGLGAWLLNLP